MHCEKEFVFLKIEVELIYSVVLSLGSFFKEGRRLVKEEILENKVYFPNWNPHTLLVGI